MPGRVLVAIDNHSAIFAAVLGVRCVGFLDLFEVIAPLAAYFEAFRAVSVGQFIGFDGQMAVTTSQPVALFREESEIAVTAGIHNAPVMPPSYFP
jgi:hypothetical protein